MDSGALPALSAFSPPSALLKALLSTFSVRAHRRPSGVWGLEASWGDVIKTIFRLPQSDGLQRACFWSAARG